MERLQKVMAHAGVASRRASEQMIQDGRVRVNGEIVTEMGFKVSPRDVIEVDGRLIQEEEKVYYLLNKPADVLSTVSDEWDRPTVIDLLEDVEERIYPVGRLDADTTGLLVLTNDGDLAYQLTHPKFEVKKTYLAEVDGHLSPSDLSALQEGVFIDGEKTAPAEAELVETRGETSLARLTIHEGRYHQVKKMFQAVDHPVKRLHRESLAFLDLQGLEIGDYRPLKKEELQALADLLGD